MQISDYCFNYFKLTLGIIQEPYIRGENKLTFSIVRFQEPTWIFMAEIFDNTVHTDLFQIRAERSKETNPLWIHS